MWFKTVTAAVIGTAIRVVFGFVFCKLESFVSVVLSVTHLLSSIDSMYVCLILLFEFVIILHFHQLSELINFICHFIIH